MSPFRFMGEQEDPQFDEIEARGGTRVYDATGGTYAVRVFDCAGEARAFERLSFEQCVEVAVGLSKAYPGAVVQTFNDAEVDLGRADGLTEEEREAIEAAIAEGQS